MYLTPNLFIIGAARCGTTSLHSILGQHPDIHASGWKEPTFFVGTSYQFVSNPIAYFNLFRSAKPYRMESSPAYLPSPETPPVLHALFPDARFIVSLREPKARAYALYRHMRFNGLEDQATFYEALQAEDARHASREFNTSAPWDITSYLYRRSTFYDVHLARYLNLFARNQFYVTTLGALAADPTAETQRILRFMDLDPEPARQFNYSVKARYETYDHWDERSDALMNTAFEGLIQRTEQLIGHPLDWRM